MTNPPNIFTAFRPSVDGVDPIGDGDSLLILRRSGAVQVINSGYDRNRLTLPPEQQTDEDRFMIRQGEKLFALALAATNDRLMNFLLTASRNPDLVDYELLSAMTRLN